MSIRIPRVLGTQNCTQNIIFYYTTWGIFSFVENTTGIAETKEVCAVMLILINVQLQLSTARLRTHMGHLRHCWCRRAGGDVIGNEQNPLLMSEDLTV